MNPVAEKICPRCRCEYLATATQCADCDIELVRPDQVTDEPPPEELPPPSEMVPIRIASVAFVRMLSEMLQAADIPHRVDTPPEDHGGAGARARRQSHDQGVAIYVLAQDVEAAQEVDKEFFRRAIPDQPIDTPATDDESCPACGEAVTAEAEECPDCGLPFLAPE